MIYSSWRVKRFRVGSHKAEIVLETLDEIFGDKVINHTANSSKDLYFDLATFSVIVPKSIGCEITSVYPGTLSGSTGSRKKA